MSSTLLAHGPQPDEPLIDFIIESSPFGATNSLRVVLTAYGQRTLGRTPTQTHLLLEDRLIHARDRRLVRAWHRQWRLGRDGKTYAPKQLKEYDQLYVVLNMQYVPRYKHYAIQVQRAECRMHPQDVVVSFAHDAMWVKLNDLNTQHRALAMDRVRRYLHSVGLEPTNVLVDSKSVDGHEYVLTLFDDEYRVRTETAATSNTDVRILREGTTDGTLLATPRTVDEIANMLQYVAPSGRRYPFALLDQKPTQSFRVLNFGAPGPSGSRGVVVVYEPVPPPVQERTPEQEPDDDEQLDQSSERLHVISRQINALHFELEANRLLYAEIESLPMYGKFRTSRRRHRELAIIGLVKDRLTRLARYSVARVTHANSDLLLAFQQSVAGSPLVYGHPVQFVDSRQTKGVDRYVVSYFDRRSMRRPRCWLMLTVRDNEHVRVTGSCWKANVSQEVVRNLYYLAAMATVQPQTLVRVELDATDATLDEVEVPRIDRSELSKKEVWNIDLATRFDWSLPKIVERADRGGDREKAAGATKASAKLDERFFY